jgi:hypothetical protein
MTSHPAAPARKTLVGAPHPGDLSGAVTVVVPAPVASDAVAQAVAQAAAQVGVGRQVMNGVLPVLPGTLPVLRGGGIVGLTGGLTTDRIVARIVVLEAGLIVRASGVAQC